VDAIIAASSAPESAAAPPAPTQALSGTLNAAEREMILQALAQKYGLTREG